MTDQERREAIEHRDIILDIRAVLATKFGRNLIKYLFKYQEVTELPELGMEGLLLSDRLGSLRPGRAFFKLVSEADHLSAGAILAEVEKEKQEALYANTKTERSETDGQQTGNY